MSELMSNVGGEIYSVQSDYVETMWEHNGKIILEHEKHTGSEAMVDAFFAVQYDDKGIEIGRRWLGQGVQIIWKVKNE